MAGGDVRVSNHTHSHQHQHNHTLHAHGPVVINHAHTHHHQHQVVIRPVITAPPPERPVFALQAPPAPPARKLKPAPRPAYDITPAQRALLALMRPLPKPDRAAVMDWMRREFGHSLVMDLTPAQLQRCRAQVLRLRQAAGVVGG